jgi:hypothetical protein
MDQVSFCPLDSDLALECGSRINYGVGILTTQTVFINNKNVILLLGFFDESTADCNTLFAVLMSPPECLGKVCSCAISRIPLPILLGGLLGKGEAGQSALCLRLTTNSKNVV